jgi:hypothetical protein
MAMDANTNLPIAQQKGEPPIGNKQAEFFSRKIF